MVTVNDIFDFLNEKYPLDTACDFDNAGFLVGNKETIVTKVLVCLDCDKFALEKASELGCELIITHHPVIFDGLKSVIHGDIVYELIKSDISVISMHTNLDIAKGGVTDSLCEILELKSIKPYTAHDGFIIRSAKTDIKNPDELALHIKEKLGYSVRYVGENLIENVLVCSGSGAEFIEDVIAEEFDALITADVKHHIFIEAINKGISVFDCGHYASEVVVVKPLTELLSDRFDETEIISYYSDKIKSV